MNKRNFLKSCLAVLIFPLLNFSSSINFFKDKIIIKKKNNKIWFFHKNDFK